MKDLKKELFYKIDRVDQANRKNSELLNKILVKLD